MTLWDETLLMHLNPCPETWGAVIQTIQSDFANFVYMDTFGHWIAVAWFGGLVRIYDIVTGSTRLSLRPMDPVKVVRGSPDGSVLFCLHWENKITTWDIQTGGLIHSFVVKEVTEIAISLKGHYLFCLFSNGFTQVAEVVRGVVNKVEDAPDQDFSPANHFCWLEPEEQVVITRKASLQIWDVVAGRMLRHFTTADHISTVVYSQELNRLAASSSFGDVITIINPQTGASSALPWLSGILYCISFSPATDELVCGMHGGGLKLFSFSLQSWRRFKYPRDVNFVSSVPNGTVVVGSMGSGIQVLSLDDRHTPPPPLASALIVSTLDQGKIIVITSAINYMHEAHLLETSTFAKLFSIQVVYTHKTIRASTASLKNRIAVYCFGIGQSRLDLYTFGSEVPKWNVTVHPAPSSIVISPSGTRLMTSHDTPHICIWDAGNGQQFQVVSPIDSFPSDITFDSETRFYTHHDNYRVPYDLNPSPSASNTHTTIRHKQQPWTVERSERKYQVDSDQKWVIRGSERIFWIPLGYLSSGPDRYCWAGSNTLVMIGEDEVLRSIIFRP